MIVVNRAWLLHVGMPAEVVVELQDAPAIMLSSLYSFAGGMGGGRYTTALLEEPKPRTLILVAMRDRYGASSGLVATVMELCCCSDGSMRGPSDTERATLIDALDQIDHPTARAVAAAVYEHAHRP